MNAEQTRADKARRALVDDPSAARRSGWTTPRRPARAATGSRPGWWRRGLALAAVSGIGITAIGVFGASNYSSTGLAFALIILVLLVRPGGLQSLWGGGQVRSH